MHDKMKGRKNETQVAIASPSPLLVKDAKNPWYGALGWCVCVVGSIRSGFSSSSRRWASPKEEMQKLPKENETADELWKLLADKMALRTVSYFIVRYDEDARRRTTNSVVVTFILSRGCSCQIGEASQVCD